MRRNRVTAKHGASTKLRAEEEMKVLQLSSAKFMSVSSGYSQGVYHQEYLECPTSRNSILA